MYVPNQIIMCVQSKLEIECTSLMFAGLDILDEAEGPNNNVCIFTVARISEGECGYTKVRNTICWKKFSRGCAHSIHNSFGWCCDQTNACGKSFSKPYFMSSVISCCFFASSSELGVVSTVLLSHC